MPHKEEKSPVVIAQQLLPLPGGLDCTPLFHSNSPEVVARSGILLSTFPADGKTISHAHLNHPLQGKFSVFFHHIVDSAKSVERGDAYFALVAGNASKGTSVHLQVEQASTYLTRPDSPFIELDSVLNNDRGEHYSGPGDRVSLDTMQMRSLVAYRKEHTIEPDGSVLLCCVPIPVTPLISRANGRTGLFRIHSNGPVYLASMVMFSERSLFAAEDPGLPAWMQLLQNGDLISPRDKAPTPPGATGELIYGRVAGVATGAYWRGILTNDEEKQAFSIETGGAFSLPISTVCAGTFGTGQIQSAPLAVRYGDTAYSSHGNYGVTYEIIMPFHNRTHSPLKIALAFQSPIKDSNNPSTLQFHRDPPPRTVFRGTVGFTWTADSSDGSPPGEKFIHLVQKQGQQQSPIVELSISPQTVRQVTFKLVYPADCTPPHVLSISVTSSS